MKKLSETILSKTYYAIKEMSKITDIKVPLMESVHFKEFTVNFDKAGKKLSELESTLLKKNIQIGASTTESIPELGETAVFSVTETHSKEDIDRLCLALAEVLEG